MREYTEQANKFLADHGLTFSAKFIDRDHFFDGDKDTRNIYLMTLTRATGDARKRYTTKFGDSVANTIKGEKPTAYDLLTCITKSDPGTFEDFCDEFGYDTDSRKAEKTYKAVKRDWEKVSKFFTAEQIEQLQEIQ